MAGGIGLQQRARVQLGRRSASIQAADRRSNLPVSSTAPSHLLDRDGLLFRLRTGPFQ